MYPIPLSLCMLVKNSTDNILKYFSHFPQKKRLDISSKLSPGEQAIAWNVKAYFLGKKSSIFCLRNLPKAWLSIKLLFPVKTVTEFLSVASKRLIFTTLWANSADNKLMVFFLLFPENKIWQILQIISIETILICMKYQILFSGKNKKNVVCWIFYPEC